MNTYVCSDIHGCFDKFMKMLQAIDFSKEDQLIIAGDYIDRGQQNAEMLHWILNAPENVLLLCGNHDKEFVTNVELMQQVMETELKNFDINSADANKILYQLTRVLLSEDGEDNLFDYYGTISRLVDENQATFKDLAKWAVALDELPYFYKLRINGRQCIIVHAGYAKALDGIETKGDFQEIEDFYIYAREEAYIHGGIPNGMIIAGHTPTIAENEFTFNNGNVFRFYDEKKDCIFYDIDCGCSYANVRDNARLACIRLEDEKVFYV